MKLVPYSSDHLDLLPDFGNQEAIVRPFLARLQGCRYEDSGPAFSGFVGETIVGCAGLIENHAHMATAWALLPKQEMAQRFVAIHRAVGDFLDRQSYRRINAHVLYQDRVGHRWARMLGFRIEVFCRPHYAPDGSAVTEYVRWRR